MNLSDSIKHIRQRALMNQEEFAKELNVGLTSVNRWEVGKSLPNIAAMKKIKAFCEVQGLPFDAIESAWLSARTEARK